MKSFLTAAGIAALVALFEQGALSTPVARAPGLKVDVTGPASVDSTSALKVTTKITNTGSAPLKVLNFNSPLTTAPLNTFSVAKDGKAVGFKGIKASYKLPTDAGASEAFTTIGAGESVSVDHDIGALYDWSAAGEGKFTIESSKTFLYTTDGTAVKAISGLQSLSAASGSKLEVEVTGDLKAAQLVKNTKRDQTIDCSADQSSFIFSSLTEAVQLAQASSDYISANGADDLFTAYFGTTDPQEIIGHFNNVAGIDANDDGQGTPWYCSDPYGACSQGVIAYTVPSTGDGAFCSLFFDEVTQAELCSGQTTVADRDVRGGTTLHEETHLLDGTDDYGYGVDFDKNLAATDPASAANNADNHNTFATEVWLASKC